MKPEVDPVTSLRAVEAQAEQEWVVAESTRACLGPLLLILKTADYTGAPDAVIS